MSVRSYPIEKLSSWDSMVSNPNDMNGVAFFSWFNHCLRYCWCVIVLMWCLGFLITHIHFLLVWNRQQYRRRRCKCNCGGFEDKQDVDDIEFALYVSPSSLILSWLSIRLSHHACVYDDEKHEKKKECETCLYGPIRSRSFLLQIRWFQTQMIWWTVLHSSVFMIQTLFEILLMMCICFDVMLGLSYNSHAIFACMKQAIRSETKVQRQLRGLWRQTRIWRH